MVYCVIIYTINMQASKTFIAKKYAEALFEVATQKKKVDVISKELLQLLKILENNHKYRYFIVNKIVPSKIKYLFFNTAAEKEKFNHLITNLVKVLIKNNRIHLIELVVKNYEMLIQEHNNQQTVLLQSAVEIDTKTQNTITKALTKALGKDILLETQRNKNLVGGIILRYGSKMLDMSISSKLNAIHRSCLKKN